MSEEKGELKKQLCEIRGLGYDSETVIDQMWSEIPKTISWHMENPEDMKGDGFVRIPYKEFWDLIEWFLRWKGKQ